MARTSNRSDALEALRRDVAEAGTTVGLSEYEGKTVFIRKYIYTKNEQDNRDVVDITLDDGAHVRSGGALLMTSFQKIDETLSKHKMTLDELYDQGYALQGVFRQKQSINNARRFYWTVALSIVPYASQPEE